MTSSQQQGPLSHTDHEVYVATSAGAVGPCGMIITWVLPATLVPEIPRVVMVLSVKNATTEAIHHSGRCLLHLLSETQADLVPHFGLDSSRDRNKFAELPPSTGTVRAIDQMPVLEGTCGWMHCSVLDTMSIGDRDVVVADVIDQTLDQGRKPLRKRAALQAQPDTVMQALLNKRTTDGERDRLLIRKRPSR